MRVFTGLVWGKLKIEDWKLEIENGWWRLSPALILQFPISNPQFPMLDVPVKLTGDQEQGWRVLEAARLVTRRGSEGERSFDVQFLAF